MQILITGGAGFIGSNLTLELQKRYPDAEIVVIDNFTSGYFKNLIPFKGEFLSGDISDRDFWDYLGKNYKFDVVFHQAAITDTTVSDQNLMVKVNTNAFKYLLDTAINRWGAKVIYASSAAVYGNCPAPMKEEGCLRPENVYGYSKLAMDNITKKYLRLYPEAQIVGLRYFNVYGPREAHKGKFASMVYQLAVKMARGQRPRLFKWGEQKRDFVYVKDVLQANLLAMEKPVRGIFNVGSGKARSFNELVAILNKELGTNLEIEYFDNPYDFYQNYTEADLTKSRQILGYNPRWSLEEGVRDYIGWLKENGFI
ncbi:MAG: ADP-glyceromanno-heptose 6-epimerase [Aquificae bacterium]|nr:ADP-glyceromanno-heptose 6-epimerase [Aquificota bacterium]